MSNKYYQIKNVWPRSWQEIIIWDRDGERGISVSVNRSETGITTLQVTQMGLAVETELSIIINGSKTVSNLIQSRWCNWDETNFSPGTETQTRFPLSPTWVWHCALAYWLQVSSSQPSSFDHHHNCQVNIVLIMFHHKWVLGSGVYLVYQPQGLLWVDFDMIYIFWVES